MNELHDAWTWVRGSLRDLMTPDNIASLFGALTAVYLGNTPLKPGALIAAVGLGAVGAYYASKIILVVQPSLSAGSAPIAYFAGLVVLKVAAGAMLRFDRFKRGEANLTQVVEDISGKKLGGS